MIKSTHKDFKGVLELILKSIVLATVNKVLQFLLEKQVREPTDLALIFCSLIFKRAIQITRNEPTLILEL
jgi:hypothetical protein